MILPEINIQVFQTVLHHMGRRLMKTLNNTQKRVYDYLVKALDEDGVPPSIREIGAAVGLIFLH